MKTRLIWKRKNENDTNIKRIYQEWKMKETWILRKKNDDTNIKKEKWKTLWRRQEKEWK